MGLTKNEKAVLEFLKFRKYLSPTEIGNAVGDVTARGYLRGSSWASPICLKLVGKGLLIRNRCGWYKLKMLKGQDD